MSTGGQIEERLKPMLKKRLFAALSKAATRAEQMLPRVTSPRGVPGRKFPTSPLQVH
jgi:hypothetical protein